MIRSYEIISSRTIHISFVDAVIHPLVQSRLEALNLSSLIVVPALRFDIQRLVTHCRSPVTHSTHEDTGIWIYERTAFEIIRIDGWVRKVIIIAIIARPLCVAFAPLVVATRIGDVVPQIFISCPNIPWIRLFIRDCNREVVANLWSCIGF